MLEGIMLGAVTWLSFFLTWKHSPGPVKWLTFKFPFAADLTASALAFILLSGISKSVIAVIGAIVTGLLVNFSLIIGKTYVQHTFKT